MNSLISGIIERRSVRKFKPGRVSEELLGLLVKAATFAPSAMNTQLWHFTVVENRERIDRITDALRSASTHESVPDFLSKMVAKPTYTVNYGAPVLIVVSGDRSRSTTINDCTLAAGNIMLAAHSLGLGSCWINQLNVVCDVPAFRRVLTELGVPEEYAVYASVCVGHPEGPIPDPAERRTDVVNYVR